RDLAAQMQQESTVRDVHDPYAFDRVQSSHDTTQLVLVCHDRQIAHRHMTAGLDHVDRDDVSPAFGDYAGHLAEMIMIRLHLQANNVAFAAGQYGRAHV